MTPFKSMSSVITFIRQLCNLMSFACLSSLENYFHCAFISQWLNLSIHKKKKRLDIIVALAFFYFPVLLRAMSNPGSEVVAFSTIL